MTTANLLRNAGALLCVFALAPPSFAQTDIPQLPSGVFAEPAALTRGVNMLERRVAEGSVQDPSDGFFVDFSNMITGSGWISAGPGYRQHLLNHRALFTASAGLSWRLYKMEL